jgi:hypothetical protein
VVEASVVEASVVEASVVEQCGGGGPAAATPNPSSLPSAMRDAAIG